ncbi:MAG: Uma2 family endonuclease, partial [Acidobacteriota bacterium]|nr:Uma2 family endonuclease [Acidobacteriota bacterium]
MTAQPEKKKFTPAEYLALEEAAESKSEYWNGEIVAMSGARIDHQQIVSNLTVQLANDLKGRSR